MKPLDRDLLNPHDAHHVLQGTGNEEILLLQPELLAADVLVVGIENLGQVFRDDLLFHGPVVVAAVEGFEIEGFGRAGLPEPQGVGGIRPIPANGRVIGYALDHLPRHPADMGFAVVIRESLGIAPQLDLDRPFRARYVPRIPETQPLIGFFNLPAIDDGLLEDAVLITDAIAQRRHVEGGHRVHVARRQPA